MKLSSVTVCMPYKTSYWKSQFRPGTSAVCGLIHLSKQCPQSLTRFRTLETSRYFKRRHLMCFPYGFLPLSSNVPYHWRKSLLNPCWWTRSFCHVQSGWWLCWLSAGSWSLLTHWRCGSDFKSVISGHLLHIILRSTSCEIALQSQQCFR